MHKYFFLSLVVMALILFACSDKDTQAPYSYNCSLNGTVTFQDASADTVLATVKLYQQGTNQFLAETVTDTTGHYEFHHLTNLMVEVHVEADRFDSQVVSNIQLQAGQTVTATVANLVPLPQIAIRTNTIDGVLDAGWLPTYQNTITSDWGASNEIKALYLARDTLNLYIAITGSFATSENTVNLYLDKDYGVNPKTGVSAFATITGGNVGDHLRKNVTVQGSFGADIGFSAWHLTGDTSIAQLVSSGTATAFTTAQIHVASNPNADDVIELAIPLSELYGSDIVPTNTKIAVVALIGGGDDQYIANDTLPMMPAQTNPHTTTNPFVFSDVIRIKM